MCFVRDPAVLHDPPERSPWFMQNTRLRLRAGGSKTVWPYLALTSEEGGVINASGWRRSPAAFAWRLKPGDNVLEVAASNKFGRRGMPSLALVNFNLSRADDGCYKGIVEGRRAEQDSHGRFAQARLASEGVATSMRS